MGDESREDTNEHWEVTDKRRWSASPASRISSNADWHHHTPRRGRTQPPEKITRLTSGGHKQQEGPHGGQDENRGTGWKMSWDTPKRWV